MSTVLVTGADGFIGSHLTEALVRAGRNVRAFVAYNSFNSYGWLDNCPSDIKGHFEVFAGDVRDPNGVRTSIKGCDAVLHLAALIAIPYSYHSPDTYVDTNIKGTLNIVQAATRFGRGEDCSHINERGLRNGPIRSDHRSSSVAGTIALLREQDWRRPDCDVVPSVVWNAGCRRAAFQHVRAATICASGDPDDHYPDRQRNAQDSAWRDEADARFQLCR